MNTGYKKPIFATNNTNFACNAKGMYPGLGMTDYRPNKSLYVSVYDNNKFRKFLQENGNKLRAQNLKQFELSAGCFSCEKQPKGIVPYTPGYNLQ